MTKEYLSSERIIAQENAEKVMQSLGARSVMSFERPERIKTIFESGCKGTKIPVVVNWLCPRGTQLAPDAETGKLFRRYTLTDPKEGFETDYQILPRIELEKDLARNLARFGTNSAYLKIVADDNPYCLYPACLRIDGESETKKAINKYTNYCQERFDELVPKGKIEVITWSELLGEKGFQEYLDTYQNTSLADLAPYLPKDIVKTEIDILTDHTKPNKESLNYFETFAIDCIRYFAVEGLFLEKLFGDDVIIAWNDSTRISRTIDALRLKNGLPSLPKFYCLHEKREGKLINNF